MTPPIRIYSTPDLPIFFHPPWGTTGLQEISNPSSLHFIRQSPSLQNLLGNFTTGRIPLSSLAPKSPLSLSEPPRLIQFNGWEFLAQLVDQIESMDLDIYQVPVNRGEGGCRFSEFTPRESRPEHCSIEVQPHTTARVYAEIRPVEGESQSMITRFIVDYSPNLSYRLDNLLLPDLEIDGFQAVVAPEISFKDPLQGTDAVLDATEVDYQYEAPLGNGGPYHTPFDTARPPLPGGYHDWMVRFQPVSDSVMAYLEEKVGNPQGKVLLWPFLLQLGYYEKQDYEKFGIRFDTLPRRPGDLLRFFTQLTKAQSEYRRQHAPYINPNSQYINSQGHRGEIPKDPKELEQINRERSQWGRPKIEKNYFKAFDFDFSELAADPDRLAAMKPEEMPRAIAHLRLKECILDSPLGKIAIDSGTDIRAHLYLQKIFNPQTKKFEGQRGVQLIIKNLDFKNIDLNPFGFDLKADSLKAEEVVFQIPFVSTPSILTVKMRGVNAENFSFTDPKRSFHLKLASGHTETLSLSNKKRNLDLSLGEITANGVDVDGLFGRLVINDVKIPAQNLQVQYWHDGDITKPQELTLRIGKLISSGKLVLNKENAPVFETSGSSTVSQFIFHNFFERSQSRISTQFNFTGAVESAVTRLASVGTIQFNTIEQNESQKIPHPMSGSVEGHIKVSHNPITPLPPIDYKINMTLPYVGFSTQGRLKIPGAGAQLREAKVEINQGGIDVEGELNLWDASLAGFGEGYTQFGRFLLPENNPKLEHINIHGRAHLKFDATGFNLGRAEGSSTPLQLNMELADSNLNFNHNLENNWVEKLVSSKIIHSGVQITKALVEVGDLRNFEYRKTEPGLATGGSFSKIAAGPLTIHHVEGTGVIWAPLPLLNYILGDFPNIGSGSGEASFRQPNVRPLLKHLPDEVQSLLGTSDFFRVEDIDVDLTPGAWNFQLRDTTLNVHERGKQNQFLMLFYPQIFVNGNPNEIHPQMGRGNYYANVFLQAQERGGRIRLFRWPISPKSKEYYFSSEGH